MKIDLIISCCIPSSICGCKKCEGKLAQHGLPDSVLLKRPDNSEGLLDPIKSVLDNARRREKISFPHDDISIDDVEIMFRADTLLLQYCSIIKKTEREMNVAWSLDWPKDANLKLFSQCLALFLLESSLGLVPITERGGPGFPYHKWAFQIGSYKFFDDIIDIETSAQGIYNALIETNK
jgi:hypothetical protein